MNKTAMVQQLARNGMSIAEIAETTGISKSMVYVYVNRAKEMPEEKPRKIEYTHMGSAAETELFRWQWTAAVNRLRIYAGLKPLAWPEITIPKPKETKAKAQRD